MLKLSRGDVLAPRSIYRHRHWLDAAEPHAVRCGPAVQRRAVRAAGAVGGVRGGALLCATLALLLAIPFDFGEQLDGSPGGGGQDVCFEEAAHFCFISLNKCF